MISRVQGTLLTRDSSRVEVETRGGVVYEVEVPLTVLERLPSAGDLVELRTVQIVTESSVSLYGFLSVHERSLFQRLLTTLDAIANRRRTVARFKPSHLAASQRLPWTRFITSSKAGASIRRSNSGYRSPGASPSAERTF